MRKKNNRKPVPGARGLLRLRCKCCGREFGTFLHIPQVSIGCHCGATISLEGLCAYEFDCECCGVHQAKRHSLFPVSAAILLHRKEDIRAVRCSFAHGITAAP